jgi:hypothetical protein
MSIRKLGLLAAACVAALVIAPITSASAAVPKLKCNFEGNATFNKALPFAEAKNIHYAFKGEKVENNVKGEPGPGLHCEGEGEKYKVLKVEVEGKGELACVVSQNVATLSGTGEEGHGVLEIEGEKTKVVTKFNIKAFSFASVAGLLAFKATIEDPTTKETAEAAGTANFLEPGEKKEKEERLEKCREGKLEKLPFYVREAEIL